MDDYDQFSMSPLGSKRTSEEFRKSNLGLGALKVGCADFPDLCARSGCTCRMPKRMLALAATEIRRRSDFPHCSHSTVSIAANFKPTIRCSWFQQSRRRIKRTRADYMSDCAVRRTSLTAGTVRFSFLLLINLRMVRGRATD